MIRTRYTCKGYKSEQDMVRACKQTHDVLSTMSKVL